MKKRFSLLTLIVTMLISVLVTFQITYIYAFNQYRSAETADVNTLMSMDRLEAVDYAYRNYYYYYGDIDEESLEDGLIAGYIYGAGDKFGEYMDAEEYSKFTSDSNGENVGIGIVVIENEEVGAIEVINVVPDGPADRSGILIGDLIVSVDGESVADLGYYTALANMQGKEGTKAEFTVLRDNETIDYSIERETVSQISVTGRMYSDGITAVIRIDEFDLSTPKQFKDEIAKLTSEGAERFVFDVRNNPGGDLESIVDILDYLLPEGPIIRIEDKDGTETVRESDAECFDMPMAVLVNNETASAAELFASALQDYKAAVLVGKTTYGKGSMQTILPMTDGSALRITFKMYKPPFSDSYDGIGVNPDIDIDIAEEFANISIYKLEDEQDSQLMGAIEYFNTGK